MAESHRFAEKIKQLEQQGKDLLSGGKSLAVVTE